MPLNRPLPDKVDVLIIGSGFGGSVMAAELAKAGRADEATQNICLVERGKAYPPGSFPRDPAGLSRNFWDPDAGLYGMFNVWGFKNIDAVVSSGLGGGSLIYANVMLPKDESWFTQKTPESVTVDESWMINRADLNEHYQAVTDFLGVKELPHGPGVPAEFHLAKTTRFLQNTIKANFQPNEYDSIPFDAVDDLGEVGGYAPLAVRFYDANGNPAIGAPLPPEAYDNIHGTPHRTTCKMIGECDLGCNEGAKNSLDHTYLSYASAHGVSIHTLTEVVSLRRREAESDYPFEITVQIHPSDDDDYSIEHAGDKVRTYPPPKPVSATARLHTISARRVVMAAGTIGSSFLLLDNQLALGVPPLTDGGKPVLGSRFSGNGDFLAFVRRAFGRLDATRGPVITAYRRYNAQTDAVEPGSFPDPGGDGRDDDRHGMYIQDAGYPSFATWLVQLAQSPTMAKGFIGEWAKRWWGDRRGTNDPNLSAEINEILANGEFSAKFMPLLGMGRDRPDGRFEVTVDAHGARRLACNWSVETSRSYFDTMKKRMEIIARGFGGQFVSNPLYDRLNRVITVHPVGGCPMDTSEHEGVIDTYGRVRGVEGLRVCDGSVFPGPIGPNPSLTIAAFARRSAHNLLEEPDFATAPIPADDYGVT